MKSLYGITREYNHGALLNDSDLFDSYILKQILDLTGFESIDDFNQAARDYDDDGDIPNATHKKFLNLFDLNPSDDWRANPKNEKAVTIYPGCCSSLQEPVAIPNPFQISKNSKIPIARISSINIEEVNDLFSLNIRAFISVPNFFVAITAELNSVCYVLINTLINDLGLDASELDSFKLGDVDEVEDAPIQYQVDDRRVLKRYLEACGLNGELAFDNDFLDEWAMQTRFQVETIGLASKPLIDSSGKEVVLSFDAEENLLFNCQSKSDFDQQLDQACDSSASQDLLWELSTHPWKEVRYALTYNKAASSEIIEKLSCDFSGYVRAGAAENGLLSENSRLLLSYDDDEEVRSAVVNHLPLERQLELSSDSSWKVRQIVAQNEELPLGLLKKLAYDSNEQIRYWVICNPSYPQELKIKHVSTQNDDIKVALLGGRAGLDFENESVVQALEIFAYDKNDSIKEMFFALIGEFLAPSQVFKERVLEDSNPYIRFLALNAFGQAISHEELSTMSSSDNISLRRAIALCENTPYDIRLKLSQDDNDDVRGSLLSLDDLQDDIRESLEGDQALMEYCQDIYI